jgi:cytochrome c-type biogenesis protein CcmH/NrfF
MSPKKSGFNLLAWITPGAALVVAATLVTLMLRRWGARREAQPVAASGASGSAIGATADELARLEAAVKAEDEQ